MDAGGTGRLAAQGVWGGQAIAAQGTLGTLAEALDPASPFPLDLSLSLPGLVAGSVIVFIISLGFYVTPAVLGGGKVIMVANRIANDIEVFFHWGAASALGVVLLVATLAFLALAARVVRMDRILGGGHGT